MSIKVRYFASLAEQVGRTDADLPFSSGLTAQQVWRLDNPQLGLPANVLIAVNMEFAGLETALRDGDEIAFFPPITGG